ncbi:MAG: phosphate ABC transporter permease subunit PstC [Firmicutes bacterium]|jgi:phosphate transport system permease protein|nr:phosphate ABC transporter permease subunit PstC [Bacillota bacterium]
MNRRNERAIETLLLVSACCSVAVVVLITYFVFSQGLPVFRAKGALSVLLGRTWEPMAGVYGLLPMVIGSLAVTAGALVLGVPLGVACAVFFAEVGPPRLTSAMRPWIQLLGGIPSVVYGFFGIVVVVPLVRDYIGGFGFSTLTASIILAIMILPTVINVSEDAIKAVPDEYREGSYALGATRWQTMWRVVLPAARSGIAAGVVLGMGRALGETMAVIMVAGNSPAMPRLPSMLLEPIRTLTGNIAVEMSYASGDHQRALFATGVVLFFLIVVLNMATTLTVRRETRA